MAKNKNKNAVVAPIDGEFEEVASVDETVAVEESELIEDPVEEGGVVSDAEARALFRTYKEVDAELNAAREAVTSLEQQRENCIKTIAEKVGKGPFQVNGAFVTIVTTKHGSTFFKTVGTRIQNFDE
jgi:hypothetical protein